MYSDGTQGYKCVGYKACKRLDTTLKDIDINRIGCGSCSGDYSCSGLTNTDVGEKSCIGKKSCFYVINDKIDPNSCIGESSCCNGDFSCFDAE